MDVRPVLVSPGVWTLAEQPAPARLVREWEGGEDVFAILRGDPNPQSGNDLHRLTGSVEIGDAGPVLRWTTLESRLEPQLKDGGVYVSYAGATLTAVAFASVLPGLGRWIVTLTVWLVAFSTMISYSYYAEQGVIFLGGERWLTPFKLLYCSLAVVATLGFLKTDAQLDNLSGLGTGLMLFVNIPVLWFMARRAMDAYRD